MAKPGAGRATAVEGGEAAEGRAGSELFQEGKIIRRRGRARRCPRAWLCLFPRSCSHVRPSRREGEARLGGARPGGGLGEAAGTPLGKPSMPWGTIRLVVVVLGGMVMV